MFLKALPSRGICFMISSALKIGSRYSHLPWQVSHSSMMFCSHTQHHSMPLLTTCLPCMPCLWPALPYRPCQLQSRLPRGCRKLLQETLLCQTEASQLQLQHQPLESAYLEALQSLLPRHQPVLKVLAEGAGGHSLALHYVVLQKNLSLLDRTTCTASMTKQSRRNSASTASATIA